MPRHEPALIDHLRSDLGSCGIRAAGFLETAQRLLEESQATVPRLGELVSYCIREALTEIPKASGALESGQWRRLSRSVVSAAERYRVAAELPGQDREGALRELLSSIRKLKKFHEEARGIHEQRLIALMIQRAGVEPLSSGTTPVQAYQGLLSRVGTATHTSCTVVDAREYWSECLALLRQLFLPAELRNPQLDELARSDAPSEDDMATVLSLAGTRIHLQRFFGRVLSPQWLWLIEGSGVLSTGGGELWGLACSAAVRLADSHGDDVVFWLTAMYDKHGGAMEPARAIAHAAYRVGGTALQLLLKIVQRYPEDDRVAHFALNAALELDASDRMVEDLADVLMNEVGRHV